MERFRSPAVGWVLAVLITAGMSYCCCTGKTLGAILSQLSSVSLGERASLMADAHGHAGSCCMEDGDGNTQPAPSKDRAPCHCEHHKQIKKLPDAQPGVEFAAAPVLLSIPAAIVEDSPQQRVPTPLCVGVVPKPPTTLLRLRCALII